MRGFQLKPNEMMFFLDFNRTLVDYENEYDVSYNYTSEEAVSAAERSQINITKALLTFERKTGITPVICVVTNAHDSRFDFHGEQGIHNDLAMTFFRNPTNLPEEYLCRRFFKYLVYRENNYFYKINPTMPYHQIYEKINFDETAKSINYIEQFKKKESVDRILSVVDPKKDTARAMIFAGDSIKDDYPMKEIVTPHGVSKIYIRPGKVQKLTYAIMREFAEAKGAKFKSVNPRNGKRIICTDQNTFNMLSPAEQMIVRDYASGDVVFLTNPNSRGLAEGIIKSIDIINGSRPPEMGM